jgi:hypothetical protein
MFLTQICYSWKKNSTGNWDSWNNRGCFAVHKKLGSLPIEEILKPVIELAERGVVVTTNKKNV